AFLRRRDGGWHFLFQLREWHWSCFRCGVRAHCRHRRCPRCPRCTRGIALAATAAQALAEYAAALSYEDIPADVLESARACIVDTVGVATYGARFEWSIGIARYAERYG